jgi:hypothetical protein
MRACAFASSTLTGSRVGSVTSVQAQGISWRDTAPPSSSSGWFGALRVTHDGTLGRVGLDRFRARAVEQTQEIG